MNRLLFLFILLSLTSLNLTAQECYSIQVKAVLMSKHEQGLALYNQLKAKNYLVYYYQLPLNDAQWFRVRLGCFQTRATAKQFGSTLKQKENLPFFVDDTPLFTDAYQDKFKVITTPSAIWLQTGAQNKILHKFPGINELEMLQQTQGRIAPNGQAIVFYYDEKIFQVNLKTGLSEVLRPDVINAQPKWSFDSHYIGYLDNAQWEVETSLCVLKGENTCLVKNNAQTQKAVKSFQWHPHKNILFFVEGHAYGTVSVGGNLYAVDRAAKRHDVVIAQTEHQEIGTDFEIKKGFIYYNLYQFDDEYINKTVTPKKIKLPF